MPPYVIIPMPLYGAETEYIKIIVPVDALEFFKGPTECAWQWWVTECDAFPKGRTPVLAESLRTRAQLFGSVPMISHGVWDLRNCARTSDGFLV
jgi:hypothetical protein